MISSNMNIPFFLQELVAKFQDSDSKKADIEFQKLMRKFSDNKHISFADTYMYLIENNNSKQLNDFICELEKISKDV
ncbi:hypothetical protein [Streptococcus sanguinis]|uniref:hypothetical protein n=1 Tax=Streptococcus sanguinis TaxID=1305 RepID=UPI001CBD9B0E|nr:hypothetical protein [Streptococcus sanguinis]MBZ2041526.1 hypothetical protein [Streptococcus sanguinis]